MAHIELIAKRQEDLHGGKPDYHVYAGAQLVGRIYQTHLTGSSDNWFWGINGVMLDMSVRTVMQGYATDLEDAKANLRTAFDSWLLWASKLPPEDLKHRHVTEQLERMRAG